VCENCCGLRKVSHDLPLELQRAARWRLRAAVSVAGEAGLWLRVSTPGSGPAGCAEGDEEGRDRVEATRGRGGPWGPGPRCPPGGAPHRAHACGSARPSRPAGPHRRPRDPPRPTGRPTGPVQHPRSSTRDPAGRESVSHDAASTWLSLCGKTSS
jgi:hypothetical protein